tara:strand:- start:2595 stop:3521 length:927 start_codon:yes stop_codon:yes gene_type:complete
MLGKYKLILALYCLLLFPSKLFGLENKILFKVDNKIVTTYDILNQTIYLNLLNDEFKNFDNLKIYDLAKNAIIREIIKENELKRIYKDLKINEKFIEQFAINYFAKFNVYSLDDLKKLLKKNKLEFEYIKRKIQIQLIWNELIFKKFSSIIKIDKKLIEKEITKKKIQDELLISEIVFNIDNKDELDEKYNLIKKEITNNNFTSAAIAHSISDSSINGGNVGWIKLNSLSNQIKNKIKKMKIGDISRPIQIPGAFIILKIEDRREVLLELDVNKEIEKIVKRKTNEQLNQYSNIYYNKIKKDVRINEL